MPSPQTTLGPGTRIRLTYPVYDEAWAHLGLLFAHVAVGTTGIVSKDGQRVLFRNGTRCRLSRVSFELVSAQ
jgi:hypothetical protein